MQYYTLAACFGLLIAQQDAATRALLLKYDARFWHLDLEVSHLSLNLNQVRRPLLALRPGSLSPLPESQRLCPNPTHRYGDQLRYAGF